MILLRAASSGGKIILSGEHSVVYGYPAIAVGIDLGISVRVGIHESVEVNHPYFEYILKVFYKNFNLQKPDNLKLEIIKSELPIGKGLGSSAAIAHASFKVLAEFNEIKIEELSLIELVQEAEKYAHGIPSGVDAVTVVKGGLLVFQKNEGKLCYRPLVTTALKGKSFYLIDSGKPVESTREMIGKVSKKEEERRNKIVARVGEVTIQLIKGLENNNFNLNLLTTNQRLLEELGVVGEKAHAMVREIERIGGVVKITGAGGVKEGSGMILAYCENNSSLKALIKKNNWTFHPVEF